jgi:hypothetical protein
MLVLPLPWGHTCGRGIRRKIVVKTNIGFPFADLHDSPTLVAAKLPGAPSSRVSGRCPGFRFVENRVSFIQTPMKFSMAKSSPEELNDGLHHILAAVAVVRDVK